MRNLSILQSIVSAFFLFFLRYHITAASLTPRYVPIDDITLDCGSATSAISKGMDGRDWTGDFQSKFFPKDELNLKSNTFQALKEGIVIKAPYTTARISFSQFTYVFPVTVGPKFVRLHFYPASYSGFDGNKYKDVFNVLAGSFTLLENFSASFLAHSSQKNSVSKEFCIYVEENKKLSLTFIPFSITHSIFYAFINGIEIVSMPMDLYYSPIGTPEDHVPVYVGQSPEFYINHSMALEMVFRLNVGGSLISPSEDTGFFREWSPDNNYFKSRGILHNTSFTPNYTMIQNYIAPDEIYQSARRTMVNHTGERLNRNMHSNLRWGLTVDMGFNYLVRLHLCEIDPDVNFPGERRFIISMDYQLAEPDADVLLWTDENRYTPFYRDYVVMIKNKAVEDNSYTFFIDLKSRLDSVFQDAFLNGVEVFKLRNSDANRAGPSKMLPSLPAHASTTIPIAIGCGVGFLVVLTSVCCMVLWKLRKSRRYGSYYPLSKCWCLCWLRLNPFKGTQRGKRTSSLRKEQCHHFSLADIKIATNNFHEDLIIGVGGFGNVYKGQIDDEETMTVAIKRLNPESRQGAHEFRTEIEMLSQLRYVHLVSLIGYCNDEGEMILIYDYMTNGTLREHLYDTNNDPLPWKKRLDICIGAARGLHYLHRGVKHTIIHRDVKTTNILLDEKLVAKVSDFGLSKMDQNNDAVSTMVKGTWGYLDPEYARCQKLSEKSDVYSFGVVLLEVLCARKALNQKLEEEEWNLAHWARKCIERGTINEIIDPYLKGKIAPVCFKVFIQIAESCTRDQGIQRPTMGDVVEKLKFALELQENADAEKESTNTGGEHIYLDKLSFCVDVTNDGLWATNVHNEHGMISDSIGTGTGLTCSSFEIDSITSHKTFS